MLSVEDSSIYRFRISPESELSAQGKKELPPAKPALRPDIPVRKKAKSAGRKLPNVLIVEDNTVNSNLLMHHIKKFCNVFFSQTGNAAVEVTKREKIDAIFMDKTPVSWGCNQPGYQPWYGVRFGNTRNDPSRFREKNQRSVEGRLQQLPTARRRAVRPTLRAGSPRLQQPQPLSQRRRLAPTVCSSLRRGPELFGLDSSQLININVIFEYEIRRYTSPFWGVRVFRTN